MPLPFSSICFYWRRRRNNGRQLSSEEFGIRHFTDFTHDDLQHATKGFRGANHLAFGGSATVYKGKLRDGRRVAVKKFDQYRPDIDFMFKTEFEMLARLTHPNVVAIYGRTSTLERPFMLVYEYVKNKDLARHLHNANYDHFPWTIRMNIAVEIASVLKYIHAYDIIHRDIKPSNILLDTDKHVKVGDFELALCLPINQSHVTTTFAQGTEGYIDPEYRRTNRVTKKSDIYSFGVVMLELISSLPAIDIKRGADVNLSPMAVKIIQNQDWGKLVDHTLGFDSDPRIREMIIGVANLAVRCLDNSVDRRPSINEVLERLKVIQSIGAD